MSVGSNHESTVLLKQKEIVISKQVVFGISILPDNCGIPFLVVPILESLLAFFGAWLVCKCYVLSQAQTLS
jgi:hypothetical protein